MSHERFSANNTPDFITSHDGTQPELTVEQRRGIAPIFLGLIEDVVLNHIEESMHISSGSTTELHTPIEQKDGWRAFVTLPNSEQNSDDEFRTIQTTRASIDLQRTINGRNNGGHRYYLDEENVVRRHDYDPPVEWSDRPSLDNIGFGNKQRIPFSFSEAKPDTEDSLTVDDITLLNLEKKRIEQEKGRNYQPASADELAGLRDFLDDLR